LIFPAGDDALVEIGIIHLLRKARALGFDHRPVAFAAVVEGDVLSRQRILQAGRPGPAAKDAADCSRR
jgi:hypothetical protein